jgi:uncharacterized protein YndB with AHSA1/START domain
MPRSTRLVTRIQDLEISPDRAIVASRVFDAPRDQVFRMWTEPAHLERWWGPRGFTITIHQIDVRPGGEWSFTMHSPDGTDFANEVAYEGIHPARADCLSARERPDLSKHRDLFPRGPRTRVTVTVIVETADAREGTEARFRAAEGLRQTLERPGERLAQTTGGV